MMNIYSGYQLLFFIYKKMIDSHEYKYFNVLIKIILGVFFTILINDIFNFYNKKHQFFYIKNIKKEYLKINFEIMGCISKSKGYISKYDINYTTNLMNQINLNKKNIIFMQKAFLYGKKTDYPLISKLNYLNFLISYYDPTLVNNFLETQIELSFINKKLHFKTKKVLNIIFQNLNISMFDILLIIKKLKYRNKYINEKDLFFYNFFFYQRKTNNNYYDNNFKNKKNIDNNKLAIKKAYKLLGIKYDDNLLTIKRAYHKLLSKYHPDKLISKGYSSKKLEKAKIKTQNIHKAFNIIKKYMK
ncbi:co-chaperone DjlA [Enterobacteriaceae endosymbiont of Donacia proxima]|uniref:co-chaperone DjlA n=1 Tax=Enterobacteriaceae endosymbiont of Donacia proxima TaxID=2675782 RepID=UPI001448AB1D|nr:co-chaperone DjlA [Enterobacteriaceae endosymbiont of Donacia proxima]QJC35240.1 co-chaperone DjlA [Enterobacteriaceae endosymbiont of Donacia proxima]